MNEFRTVVQDFIEYSPLRHVFFSRHRWLTVAFSLVMAAALGIGIGWLIVEAGVLPVAALLAGFGYVLWSMYNIEIAYWGVIGIVTLLPFASLPFNIGFVPTFLDLALVMLFFVWLMPIVLGQQEHLVVTPLGALVLAFALLAIGAFVAGLSHGTLDKYLLRHFAEVLLSIALFYLVVNTVQDSARLERLIRVLILAATAEAVIGIVLYVLPDDLTMTLLSALGRLGYPVGAGVLRFVRDDPSLMQRATATSVDPNVLGSLLNIAIVLAVPQLFAERPIIRKGFLIPMIAVMGICLGLTISRGSMGGVVVAIVMLGLLRHRKLLLLLAVGAALVLLLPWTQAYIAHFAQGILLQDLSTQMRMGEYKDALILIQRYPILGVGFAATPDIDIYIGVANIYLLIAEQMGMVGLTAFLAMVGLFFARFWKRRHQARALPHLEPLWYGLHMAILGGLVAGIFDHYFFSLDFHHSVTLFWLTFGLATAATQLVDMGWQAEPHYE